MKYFKTHRKCKVFFVFNRHVLTHKTSGGMAPRFLISALDGNKWSASIFSRLTAERIAAGRDLKGDGGWGSVSMLVLLREKSLLFSKIESWFLGHLTRRLFKTLNKPFLLHYASEMAAWCEVIFVSDVPDTSSPNNLWSLAENWNGIVKWNSRSKPVLLSTFVHCSFYMKTNCD